MGKRIFYEQDLASPDLFLIVRAAVIEDDLLGLGDRGFIDLDLVAFGAWSGGIVAKNA